MSTPFLNHYWPMYTFIVLCRLCLPTLRMRRNKNRILNILVAEVSLSRGQFSHIRAFTSGLLHPTFLSLECGIWDLCLNLCYIFRYMSQSQMCQLFCLSESRKTPTKQLCKELFPIRAFHGCFCIETQITLESFPSAFIMFDLSSHLFSSLSSTHCLKWVLPRWLQVFCKVLHNLLD